MHSDPHAPGTLQGAIICILCQWDVSGSFHALQVKEEFVEVRGRFLELGKTTPFLIDFLFF